jgi:hypothetical protein
MVANRETHILISDEGLFPAEYIYPSDDLFPYDPNMRQVSNIVAGSLKLDEVISEKVPQFGQMFATKFECTVYMEEDLSGKFIHVYQVVDGVSKDVFAGKIDSCKLDKVGTDRKLIAYDLAYEKGKQNIADWWERFWTGRTTATLKQVRESLLNSANIVYEQVELPNDNLQVTKTVSLSSCTLTAMLRMVCELNYCFPHLGRDGLMQFIMLNTEPEETKDITGLYEGLNSTFEDFVTYNVTGVQFYDSGNELKFTYGNNENAYPVKENIFLYDQPTTVLQNIGAEMMDYLSDFVYTPANVKMIIGDMNLQLGDYVHTEKGNFYVMQNSYSGSQFFEQTIKAQGQELLYGGTPNFDYDATILSERIARVRQTVEMFEVDYENFKEGTAANFSVASDAITSEVRRAQQAENSLSSQIQQTANSISLSVVNGSTESSIKLKVGETELSSGTIYMQGLVKFVDILNDDSGTIINGSLITTGTIDASRVNVANLNANNIKSGSITISDAGSHVRALQIIKNNEVLAYMDADNGIVVGKDQEGYNRTSIGERGFFTGSGNKRVDISNGNVECTHTLKGQYADIIRSVSAQSLSCTAGVSCQSFSLQGSAFSKKTVTTFNNISGTAEIQYAKLSNTSLWAVNSSIAPSMKGNSTNGYSFSSNPTWRKIELSYSSYTTKIYGMTGSSVSATNRTLLGSW